MPHAHYVQTRATLCKVKVKVKVNVDMYSFGKKIPTVYSKKFFITNASVDEEEPIKLC